MSEFVALAVGDVLLQLANKNGVRGWVPKPVPDFHPIRFARFCFCAKCNRLVDRVETHHPYGLQRGPWRVQVCCHGEVHETNLSQEAVAALFAGKIKPQHTVFFTGDLSNRPEPVSPDLFAKLESGELRFGIPRKELPK